MKEMILLFVLVWSLAALLMIKAHGSLGKAYEHLRKPENKNIRGGVIGFTIGLPLLALILSLFIRPADAQEVRWFDRAELFIGADIPMKGRDSPQCKPEGPDNKITSNGGIRVYVAEYGRLSLVSQYTHHSCAFNADRNLYDAVGVHAVWRIW